MHRRTFVLGSCSTVLAAPYFVSAQKPVASHVTIFLSGDVMTGRGIDQIFPSASDPTLHEPYVSSARRYAQLAENVSGPIPRPAPHSYIWGDALDALDRAAPDFRVVNLETSVTRSDEHWPGKGIHYRMHPDNTLCLTAAGIDCCVLANNHVLDWGYAGLSETLEALGGAGIRTAGAGGNLGEAQAPAVMPLPGGGRVLVFGLASGTSGVPEAWAAGESTPGVFYVEDLSSGTLKRIAELVRSFKRAGDLVIASIHWGRNWGYDIPDRERAFAHGMIETAGADIVHGHSSHHPKAIEIYRGKTVLYGCGDLINDYEGIGGYERYRPDLSLLYLLRVDVSTGRLVALRMIPMRMKRFRLTRTTDEETEWLKAMLNREGRRFGTHVESDAEDGLISRPGMSRASG